MRTGYVQQLGDDGGYAAEVTGPFFPFQQIADAAAGDCGTEPFGIDGSGFGGEEVVNPCRAGMRCILLKGTGVSVKVFVRSELRGVDEDCENDGSGLLSGQLDKADVAFMQGPMVMTTPMSCRPRRSFSEIVCISTGSVTVCIVFSPFCWFLFRWLDGDDKLSPCFSC